MLKVIKKDEKKRLNVVHDKCPRRTLRVWWPDTTANADLRRQTEVTCMTVIIKVKKWRWTGHRLESGYDCHIVLNFLIDNKRQEGSRPTKHRSRMVKEERRPFWWSPGLISSKESWKQNKMALKYTCPMRHLEPKGTVTHHKPKI